MLKNNKVKKEENLSFDMPVDNLITKYKARLKKELGSGGFVGGKIVSHEYKSFKKSFLPGHLSFYEKACNLSEKILKISPDPKQAKKLRESLGVCHLNTTPSGAFSFSILAPLLVVFVGGLLSYLVFQSLVLPLLIFAFGLGLIFPLQKLPSFLADNWRMRASNQMVQCIFYVVTYMRHTSNLERAIEFASDHLSPPLSLDLKKILWNIETGQFDNVMDALNSYLSMWKGSNMEFVEAFHLITSSLYEPSESRRLDLLDKSLDVILSGTYDRMLHYAHDLKSPITILHMLGVILPILGLVILPLMISFMSNESLPGTRIAMYIALAYNLVLPLGVYYLGRIILAKRPSGYGDTNVSLDNPRFRKFGDFIVPLGGGSELRVNPAIVAVVVFAVLFLIGISPLLIHWFDPGFDFVVGDGMFSFLDYICPQGKVDCTFSEMIGPFGLGASVLSLGVVLSFGLSFGLFYFFRSRKLIKIRRNVKKLEQEFTSALFQLGTRLGDGLPAEIAFGKVAKTLEGTTSGDFCALVYHNLTGLGMGLEQAIFDRKIGAVSVFPSNVINSSMRVLVESAKKGPRIAAQALMNIARYVKEIHRVNERLNDLLADTITSMQSQIKFLTPAIAGIVVGITSMITTILTKLSGQLTSMTDRNADVAIGGMGGVMNMFGTGVPTYYFQLIVGIYVVQIVFILTVLSNGIQNGSDKLNERFTLGNNMIKSTILYCFIALGVIIMFNIIAAQVMSGALAG